MTGRSSRSYSVRVTPPSASVYTIWRPSLSYSFVTVPAVGELTLVIWPVAGS